MTLTKNARRIAAGAIAAAALPVAAIAGAGSADAATRAGCTVTPLAPVFSHFTPTGVKVLDYRIRVNCKPGRHAHIQQRRYEQDGFPNPDDFVGSTSLTGSGVTLLHVKRTLPNTELGNEEMYQRIRFRVHFAGGFLTPWTAWEKSGVRSFSN